MNICVTCICTADERLNRRLREPFLLFNNNKSKIFLSFFFFEALCMSCTSPQVSAVFQRSFLCCAKLEMQSAIVSLMLCGATWLSSSSIQPIECTGKLRTWRKKKTSSLKEKLKTDQRHICYPAQ